MNAPDRVKLILTYLGMPCSNCGRRQHQMRVSARNTLEAWQKMKVRHGIGCLMLGTRPARMKP